MLALCCLSTTDGLERMKFKTKITSQNSSPVHDTKAFHLFFNAMIGLEGLLLFPAH